MNDINEGVHKTHCCILHGCKYGNDACPVVQGILTQSYPCETCNEIGIESVSDITNILEKHAKTCPNCGYLLKS